MPTITPPAAPTPSPPPPAPALTRPTPTPLPATHLATLHASDSTLYPSPLTLAQLQAWHAAAPATSLLYAPDAGAVVALPIQRAYWLQLIAGELREWEITPAMLGGGGGLHVWHVERYAAWPRRWGRFADAVAADLGLGARPWSALVVTRAGRAMFERLGGRARAYAGQVVVGGRIVERAAWDGRGAVAAEAVMLVGGC